MQCTKCGVCVNLCPNKAITLNPCYPKKVAHGRPGLEQLDLADKIKLVVKENVLAVISDNGLKTVSSAIFNGGYQQVKAVLNIGVPEGYSDHSLHLDPLQLITSSAAKIGVFKDYLAMVTAAKIGNYSLSHQKNSRILCQRSRHRWLLTRRIFRRRNGR